MKKLIIQKGLFLDKMAYLKDDFIQKIKILDKNERYFEKDIFLAKKKKHNRSMKSLSLFLDENTQGFMHYDKDEKKEYVLCQIKKIQKGQKNPKLTNEISLSGKYIVYIANSRGIAISNKSENKNLLDSIKNSIDENILKNAKIIIRSRVYQDDISKIIEEIIELDKEYKNIKEKAKIISKPQMIYRQYDSDELFLSKINQKIDIIITNDKESVKKLKKSKFEIDNVYYDSGNLFQDYGINRQIDILLKDIVKIENGINIYIQKTEAMYVIDVNSAGYFKYKDNSKNAHYINTLVIDEISRQIILRDLGGIIMIDFIDMNNESLEQDLLEKMRDALKKDDRKISVVSIDESSIMKIIRKKEDSSLQEIMQEQDIIKLKSLESIFDEIDEKLRNIDYDKKNVSIYIPTFESEISKKYIQILQDKYFIKISANYLKKSDFNVKLDYK